MALCVCACVCHPPRGVLSSFFSFVSVIRSALSMSTPSSATAAAVRAAEQAPANARAVAARYGITDEYWCAPHFGDLSEADWSQVLAYLSAPACPVRALSICRTNPSEGGPYTVLEVQRICQMLQANHSIEHVDFSGRALNDECAHLLCAALQASRNLRDVVLHCCRIGPMGAGVFAGVVAHNTSLRCLRLHGNPLTKEGAQLVFQALPSNTTLEMLDLSCTGIEAGQYGHILRALQQNHSLTTLRFATRGEENKEVYDQVLERLHENALKACKASNEIE